MRISYLKIIICLVVIVWIVYLIQEYTQKQKQKNITENFTSHIHAMYRPYVRHINKRYEYFVNEYGPQVIWLKLRKWTNY